MDWKDIDIDPAIVFGERPKIISYFLQRHHLLIAQARIISYRRTRKKHGRLTTH